MGRCGGDKILEHVLQKFSFVCQYCFIMVFNIRLPSFFCHVFRQSVFCGFAVYIIARPGLHSAPPIEYVENRYRLGCVCFPGRALI